jgi:hypothetical protein
LVGALIVEKGFIHDGEIASALSCVELISQILSIRMCFDTKKDVRMASSS